MPEKFKVVNEPKFYGDKEWYEKELMDRLKHFYGRIDGSYLFPNSMEGDLLIMLLNLLLLSSKEDDSTRQLANIIPSDLQLSAIQFSVMHLMNVISDIEKIIATSSDPEKVKKWEKQLVEYTNKLRIFEALQKE